MKVWLITGAALSMITPAIEARLTATHADERLSQSTDGAF
jgi:hypothetical protein